jgi:hypothetical protein
MVGSVFGGTVWLAGGALVDGPFAGWEQRIVGDTATAASAAGDEDSTDRPFPGCGTACGGTVVDAGHWRVRVRCHCWHSGHW